MLLVLVAVVRGKRRTEKGRKEEGNVLYVMSRVASFNNTDHNKTHGPVAAVAINATAFSGGLCCFLLPFC